MPSDPFALLDEERPRELLCICDCCGTAQTTSPGAAYLSFGRTALELFGVYELADQRGERYHATLAAIAADPDTTGGHMRNRLADEIGKSTSS